jgi:indole-3-glycerol phosphate synthase
MSKPIIIAEVKTESPFGFKSEKTWDELFAIANEVGDWLSIHTDPRWGGDFSLIRKARALTKKPILAKGIHATDAEIRKALVNGADYVLVVGRLPSDDLLSKCLIEPTTHMGLARIRPEIKTVWNSRDLKTGKDKCETYKTARLIRPKGQGWLCQASNIKTIDDVHPEADAIIVGTNLEEFARSLG